MEILDRAKVTDEFEFPLVLDMSPFLEHGDMDVLRATDSVSSTGSDAAIAAAVESIKDRSVWLSSLATEEGRLHAAAVSASHSHSPNVDKVWDGVGWKQVLDAAHCATGQRSPLDANRGRRTCIF